MKVVIDDWSWKWKVDFSDKVGGAFSTGGGQAGDKEFVLVLLVMFMLNNRMVVAGPLYRNEKTGSVRAEVGARRRPVRWTPASAKANWTAPGGSENMWLDWR